MKQVLSVLNTDSINRYGYRFSVEALIYSLWREHDTGVPIIVGHDSLRPIGWSYPTAVHFEPGMARLVGLGNMVETDEEVEQLSQNLRFFSYKMAESYETDIDQLKKLLENYLNGKEKILLTKECLALVEEGLCTRVFSHLLDYEDNDGLVPFEILNPLGPGVYKISDFAVFAHPFFRRSLSRFNSLNSSFLGRLQNIKGESASVKIALDPDMVGLASTYQEYEELQYWWGPIFDDDLTNIPTGVTHHEAEETDKIFFGISGTQFWWQSRDGMHIFEAEELRDVPSIAIDETKFGCRYVHSMVQEENGEIVHFDGAVRVYKEEKMIERLEKDLAHAGRQTEYKKLWRIDGVITTPHWKELLSDYFRDNRLVGEYLGASEDEMVDYVPEHNVEQQSILKRYVPFSMKKGDGIRMALSYHKFEEFELDRKVIALDVVSSPAGTDTLRVVDTWTIELKKILDRLNGPLFVPDDIYLLSFKDFYTNLPVILHNRAGFPKNLYKTMEGIETLISGFSKRGYDQIVTYTIGLPFEDKELRISVLGHIEDLVKWLSNPLSMPPTTSQEEIYEWATKVSSYLKEEYPVIYDQPSLFETLMFSGVLMTQRNRLEEKFNFKLEKTDEGLGIQLKIPKNEKGLREAVKKGEIAPALAYLKLESKCTNCGQLYKTCGCSKLIDDGVAEHITDAKFAFAFWTDRPVW